jgi:hypothetical protein
LFNIAKLGIIYGRRAYSQNWECNYKILSVLKMAKTFFVVVILDVSTVNTVDRHERQNEVTTGTLLTVH